MKILSEQFQPIKEESKIDSVFNEWQSRDTRRDDEIFHRLDDVTVDEWKEHYYNKIKPVISAGEIYSTKIAFGGMMPFGHLYAQREEGIKQALAQLRKEGLNFRIWHSNNYDWISYSKYTIKPKDVVK